MVAHPLDPLDDVELQQIAAGLRSAGVLRDGVLVAGVALDEPDKAALAAWRPGDSPKRIARLSLWDSATRTMSLAYVSVDGELLSLAAEPSAVAPMISTQADAAMDAARADPRFQAAILARGIRDMAEVYLETWPFGSAVPDNVDGDRRLVWTPLWHRPTPEANVYAHPISGLRAIVDLDTAEVLAVEDEGIVPIPSTPGPYRSDQTGADIHLKPLTISQPEGASFEMDGWAVAWERWRLRIGFDQREGLVIHDVRFVDGDIERRIAHRLSIAELVIPYGDTVAEAHRKQAFDTGEFGLGAYTNSLVLGCDCLGEIVYRDVTLMDPTGDVRVVKQGICLHEEDFGILWKHTDEHGHVEERRGRRFVASSIVTINNNEYGYFWYFYQDGSIEFEAKLTGIVLTIAGKPGPSSTELEPGLLAPYHQHIFCARLDLDVDGASNSVVEVESEALPPGPDNPHGAAYTTCATHLKSELQARRTVDPFNGRYWKVVNPNSTNHLGDAVGYKLVPGHTTYPMASPDSVIGRRAGFMYHHLWVTPYDGEERYPAGEYPFMHPGGAGLPTWTARDRALTDTDVVLWYSFGTNHIPRTEDWPVMPVERVGFHLKPVGFFRRSPGIDVAPQPGHCH